MRRLKINNIIGSAALALILAAVGCTRINDMPSGGSTALMNVNADLGAASKKAVTRAIPDDDPTLASIEERIEEGYVMKLTLDFITEIYKYDNGRFIPDNEPIYFPNPEDAVIDFWFGTDGGPAGGAIANQNGSAAGLLAADVLTASQTFSPASSISGITLTHVNSLIELSFAENLDRNEIADVRIGGFLAYNIPQTDRYLSIIQPGTDEFTIALTYKGVPGYEIVVAKDAITGEVKEFESNNRYILSLDIDEINLTLRLLAISIARWINSENVEAVTPTITTKFILYENDSNGLIVVFTNGDIETIDGSNGYFELEVADPDNPRTIYSIQRLVDGSQVGDPILIGRTEGETISLMIGSTGVILRNIDNNGNIRIGSYAELALINTDATSLSGTYLQEADIDLLGENLNWTPIGNNNSKFTGIYDGGGHEIKNMYYINPNGQYAGLFGNCLNATLRNIHISSGSVTGTQYVGGICGENEAISGIATIYGCSNAATISASTNYSGGICGHNVGSFTGSATISACRNIGTVTGGNGVGGVCGYNVITTDSSNNEAIVIECYSAAAVRATATSGTIYVGGVSGFNNGSIIHCFWGIGTGDAGINNATLATNNNNLGTGGAAYQFSETNWPGIISTPGYWNFNDNGVRDDVNGRWESLGEWLGNAAASIYPTLKTPLP